MSMSDYNVMHIQIKIQTSGFKYFVFDIELDLIELKGTVKPWQRYALY